MDPPAIPLDESARLAALRELRVLDTSPEERYDRITRIAQGLFGVPIALVSLVDADRQWFKSRQGLEAAQTGRDVSFCGHAILGSEALVVDDTASDARFADNPLVTGDPRIRFYAGHPLRAPEGHRVGTLCVIDREPRKFDAGQRQLLRDLAALVEIELGAGELAERAARHASGEQALLAFLDDATDLIQSVSNDGRILYANRTWRTVLGWPPGELPDSIFDVIVPAQHEHCRAALGRVLQGETVTDVETVFRTRKGRELDVIGSVNAVYRDGAVVATRGIFRDATRAVLRRKTLERMAETDPLTGLLNRRGFDQRAGDCLADPRLGRAPVSLVMIDLDHFKRINDEHGHPAGDAVLQRLARVLHAGLRSDDVAARAGGEEFCLLLPRLDCWGAQAVADRLRRRFADVSGEGPPATFSAGIADRGDAPDLASLWVLADRALYEAKAAGRNRVLLARDLPRG